MLSLFLNVQAVSPRFSNPVVLLPKIPKSPIHSRRSFLCHSFLKPPTMPPRASSSSTKVFAEYAKSNRSSCKKCSKTIAVQALRLGLVSRDARGFDVTKWHHLGCFSFGPYSLASVEAIKGFDSLKVWENWGCWVFVEVLYCLVGEGITRTKDFFYNFDFLRCLECGIKHQTLFPTSPFTNFSLHFVRG